MVSSISSLPFQPPAAAMKSPAGALTSKEAIQAAKPEELKAAFGDFVGNTFYGQLIASMRKTVDKPAYFHGGRGEEVFQGQLDQMMAEKLSDATQEQFAGPMFELFMLKRSSCRKVRDSKYEIRKLKAHFMIALTPDNTSAPTFNWEQGLADLLGELSSVQDELLAVLIAKKDCLAGAELEELADLQARELALGERLQACHQRRTEMLAAAKEQNLPGDSLGQLAATLPTRQRDKLGKQVKESQAQTRLLQNQSITNWVLAQRSLLHVSQLLEIIATGGRLQPTYGEGETVHSVGSLVNQEA